MIFELVAVSISVGLFVGMLLFFEAGRRLGLARRVRDPDGASKGSGPVEAAVFGLLGLLLAFTFSGAASRFEDRRHLIAEEANAVGTAYLRVDLLPADLRPEMRQLFGRYLDARIDLYRHAADADAVQQGLAEVATLQGRLWETAVAGSQRPEASPQAAMLLLPALNETIDITTTRAVATENHPPPVVFVLLAGLSLISTLLVGYMMSASQVRSWFYVLLFTATMSVTRSRRPSGLSPQCTPEAVNPSGATTPPSAGENAVVRSLTITPPVPGHRGPRSRDVPVPR